MATVYLARGLRHDRFVALKVMKQAEATLGTLLSVPFYASPAWLRIDQNFIRLRDNPEFTALAGQ